jgi:hypothetical protein
MRLTVGPLPPAVYWRRRAVVLGGLIFVMIVFYASCGGSGGSEAGKKNNTSARPSATAADTPTATASAAATTDPPVVVEPPDEGGDPTAGQAPGPPPGPPAPPQTGPCTNDEMALTPVPAKTSIKAGTPMDIRLKIANASSRTCARDVGADLQELRIVRGAETIWSSDHCGAARGSDMRTFTSGGEREYMVTWNGRSSSKCTQGVPAGPVPLAGDYQVLGRLGTKLSEPIKLVLR